MEKSNTKLNRLIKLYLLGYVFFSGIVYFEPSFTELLFAVFMPLALVWGLDFDFKTLFLLQTALVVNFLSLIWGLFNFQAIDVRYNIIDLYLYINLALLVSSLYRMIRIDHDFLGKAMKWWIVMGALNISICFLAYFMGRNTILGARILFTGIRFQGFFKDPNVFGPFLIPPALYILEKILSNKKVLLRHIIGLLVFSIGILLSFSRAAWLNYFFSVVVLFISCLKSYPYVKKRIFKLTLLAGVLMVLLLNLNINFGGYSFSEFFKNRIGFQAYDEDRFTSQKEVAEMITMSPVLGIGPGNYMEVSPRGAHSLYIRALGEKGVMGFLLLVIPIMALLFNKNAYKQNRFAISSFYGILVNSIFIDTLHWRHAWIIAALILCTVKREAAINEDALKGRQEDNEYSRYFGWRVRAKDGNN